MTTAIHGTYAGAQQHWKHREECCTPCGAAASRYQYLYRITTGRTKSLGIHVDYIARIYTAAPKHVQTLISDVIGADTTDAIFGRHAS